MRTSESERDVAYALQPINGASGEFMDKVRDIFQASVASKDGKSITLNFEED